MSSTCIAHRRVQHPESPLGIVAHQPTSHRPAAAQGSRRFIFPRSLVPYSAGKVISGKPRLDQQHDDNK
ncbi:hypothetical protein M430DRAFT_36005 [Amorphotheca resinae ATCC 22711]|uniref:Uncharacterized protein n=1 Tax=Amorphotheca resinae ATCC 22711 TaxID=857342 RepID=A0A2T3AZ48_AMORE|nr:hypothetical protein M430DRAFT_36005 [Amorphotheca resinae ATCC 22711]PSS15343.1 hypothetical protein M430DRAFT_36005 [Amorphotheca resinae ATCC 22711]